MCNNFISDALVSNSIFKFHTHWKHSNGRLFRDNMKFRPIWGHLKFELSTENWISNQLITKRGRLMLTCIFRETDRKRALWNLIFEQIFLIEEQDDRCFNKPFAVTNWVEQLHRFNHSVHLFVFSKNQVITCTTMKLLQHNLGQMCDA